MSNAVTIDLKGNDSDLQKALDDSVNSFEGFGGKIKSIAGGIGQFLSDGLGFLKDYANYAKNMWAEQAASERRLNSVLEATGNAAGYTLDQLKAMAGELQSITTIGDEVTLSNMAIIATFKNIKGEQFKEATLLAMDMAEVLGVDLKQASMQVAKALNDPIMGLGALSRSGVSFSESQREMVKSLMESGDMMGAQRIILDELAGEFGGAAQDKAKSFGGQMQQISNRIGDLHEIMGKNLMPLFNELIPLWDAFVTALENTIGPVTELITLGVKWAKDWYSELTPFFEDMIEFAVMVYTSYETYWTQAFDVVELAMQGFMLSVTMIYEELKHVFLVGAPELVKWFARNWSNVIQDVASFQRTVFANMGKNILEFFKAFKDMLAGKGFTFEWTGLTEGFKATMEELPNIAKRALTENEKHMINQINQLSDRLTNSYEQNLKKNREFMDNLFTKQTGSGIDMTPTDVPYNIDLATDEAEEEIKKTKDKINKELGGGSGSGNQTGAFEDLLSLNKRIASASAKDPMLEEAQKQTRELEKIAGAIDQQNKDLENAGDENYGKNINTKEAFAGIFAPMLGSSEDATSINRDFELMAGMNPTTTQDINPNEGLPGSTYIEETLSQELTIQKNMLQTNELMLGVLKGMESKYMPAVLE